MIKNTFDKLNEILRNPVEGIYNFDADNLFVESYKNGEIAKEKITFSFVQKIYLSDDEKTVTLELIDTKEMLIEILDRIEYEFLKDTEAKQMIFPDDFQDILDKYEKYKPYIPMIVDQFLKYRVNNTLYKGFETNFEQTENGFILTKKQIYKYKAIVFPKNNIPYIKIKPIKTTYYCYAPNRRDYKEENGWFVMKYSNFEKFQDYNNISDKEILIDEKSIKKFYGFDNILFVKPTKKWVDKWWNYDCPPLTRYTTNIDGTQNGWGLCLVAWENRLVESTWNADYIDDSITIEEIEAFTQGRKYSRIYEAMMRTYNKNKMSNEEKQEILDKVKNIEKEIQNAINKNEREILIKTALELNKNYTKEDFKHCSNDDLRNFISNHEPPIFDCGFLYFAIENVEIRDLFREAAEYDDYRLKDGSLKIKYPWNGQSTTIKRIMAKYIKKFVKLITGHDLTYWTVLD